MFGDIMFGELGRSQYFQLNENKNYQFLDTEVYLYPIFDKLDPKFKMLFINDNLIINFHDIKFENNALTISYSVIAPQDHLVLEYIKQ